MSYHESQDKLHPITSTQDYSALSLQNQILIKKLALWLDCSQAQFQKIYVTTLDAMQAAWQPLCKTHALDHEQLRHDQLACAIATLTLRKGVLLPGHLLTVEQIAYEAPQWTYAVFLMACLFKIKEFFKAQKEASLKSWQEVIPEFIKAWLLSNKLLCHYLSNTTMTIAESFSNPLVKLVLEANTLLQEQTIASNIVSSVNTLVSPSPESENKQQQPLLDTLLAWVQNQGKPNETYLVVDAGLLLTTALLQVFIETQHLSENTLILALKPFLVLNQDHWQQKYRSNDYHDKKIWEGAIIARHALDNHWQNQPINTHVNLSF